MEQHLVTCPKCSNKFSVESAIENDIRETIQKEFSAKAEKQTLELQNEIKKLDIERKTLEELKEKQNDLIKAELAEKLKVAEVKIKKDAAEEVDALMNSLKEENSLKAEQVNALRLKEADFEKRERDWKDKMDAAELDLKKKLAEREGELRAEAEKRAMEKAEVAFSEKEAQMKRRQEDLSLEAEKRAAEIAEKVRNDESLKRAELQKQLDDQKKLVDEMKRKSEQGSMQLQGEVQELAIEQYLADAYPADEIEAIKTGARGADVIQIVKDPSGQVCGKIYYESKRTKDFQATWLPKLKGDMRARSADIGILVSDVLPKGVTRFYQEDGIWICSFAEFKAISLLMRETLLKIQVAVVSQENKGDKMVMLYSYLTSIEFRSHIEAIVEGFNAMKAGLNTEKKQMTKAWSEREKQIDKVILNTVGMYGSIKGIAGGAVQNIKELEMGDEFNAEEENLEDNSVNKKNEN